MTAPNATPAVRREQVLVAVALLLTALVLPLVQQPQLWPITAVGGVISALMLWGALRDESISGPVVALILTATVAMFVGDLPAFGALGSVVASIALGEHLAAVQHARYSTPGNPARPVSWEALLLHAVVATCAMGLTLAAAVVPSTRAFSGVGVAALGVLAFAVQRRRSALATQPLPSPEHVA